MVTIKMVAERCGLSIGAVSKALNGQPGVSVERAEEVRRIAQEMGYYPNSAARTLRMNRSYNIGLLFNNEMQHEFFSVVLGGIREEAERKDYDVTFLRNHGTNIDSFYDHAKYRQCDGVIIVQGDFDLQSVQRLVESELPVVSIDNVYNGRTAIISDNVVAMQEVVRFLHEQGHRRIAFVHGEDGAVTRQRLAGFYRACRELDIKVPPEYVIPARYHEPRDSGLATRQLLSLRNPPTCILYPDDTCYLGGKSEIERQGLSVPGDISCFGYDGIQIASLLRPKLSTYCQPALEIGITAARELIAAIENPKFYVPQVISISGQIQPGDTVQNLNGAD